MKMIAAYDEQAIWGIGVTSQAAKSDAKQYMSSNTDTLETARMTKRLAGLVERNGGNVAFRRVYGALMTYGAADRILSKLSKFEYLRAIN